MKRIVVLAAVVFALQSCGSKTETKNEEDYGTPETTTAVPEVSAADIIAQGQSLVKASDCKTCHHETNKLIGPAHTEVAKKYDFTAANVTMLAEKIIKGGSGVWGQIPMTGHADLSQADAEKMARYVLSLDGETEH
ncbi:MAG: c-type cytochrome [Bacteroidota bacterium]